MEVAERGSAEGSVPTLRGSAGGTEAPKAKAPQRAKTPQAARERFAQKKIGTEGQCDGIARNVAMCGGDATGRLLETLAEI